MNRVLVSPCCRAELSSLACTACGTAYGELQGVPVLVDRKSPAFLAAESRYANGREPWDYGASAVELMKYDFLFEAVHAAVSSRDDAVADIGCSSGFLAERLVGLSDRVIAIDLAATAAARVKARVKEKLTVAAASSLALPFADGSLKVAVLSDGLVSWGLDAHERAQAVAEARRALQPGGTAIFMEYLNPARHDELTDAVKAHFTLDQVSYLGDRLWYVSESVSRVLRGTGMYRAFDRSPGWAKALRSFSSKLGHRGSKHLCAIVHKPL